MTNVPSPPDATALLELPSLDPDDQPGARVVNRAVSIVLTTVALGGIGAVLVASLVRMDVTTRARGALEPTRVTSVRITHGGVVRQILVRTGDTVRAHAPLARLETVSLESSRRQLEAQIRALQVERTRSAASVPLEQRQFMERRRQAEARLATALAGLRQRMVEYKLGYNTDSLLRLYRSGQHVALDLAVGEVRSLEAEIRLVGAEGDLIDLRRYDGERFAAELEQLRARLSESDARIAAAELRAPTDGVVLTERVEKLVGLHFSDGSQLLELARLDDWRVVLMIPEHDVQRIHVGDKVSAEVMAFDHLERRRRLNGVVAQIAADPVAGPVGPTATGLYRVEVAVDPKGVADIGSHRLRRGYTVEARILGRSGSIIELVWGYIVNKIDRSV